jgi:hypothetical protein
MAVTLYLVQLAATGVMAGLIVFVAVVHYPLFARVDAGGFPAYEAEHQRRTTWVVMPPMLAELATAVAALWLAPPWLPRSLAWAGLAMLAMLWASTFLVQVPLHARLATRFDPRVHRRLVATNAIRAVLWPARLALLLYPLANALR